MTEQRLTNQVRSQTLPRLDAASERLGDLSLSRVGAAASVADTTIDFSKARVANDLKAAPAVHREPLLQARVDVGPGLNGSMPRAHVGIRRPGVLRAAVDLLLKVLRFLRDLFLLRRATSTTIVPPKANPVEQKKAAAIEPSREAAPLLVKRQ